MLSLDFQSRKIKDLSRHRLRERLFGYLQDSRRSTAALQNSIFAVLTLTSKLRYLFLSSTLDHVIESLSLLL